MMKRRILFVAVGAVAVWMAAAARAAEIRYDDVLYLDELSQATLQLKTLQRARGDRGAGAAVGGKLRDGLVDIGRGRSSIPAEVAGRGREPAKACLFTGLTLN